MAYSSTGNPPSRIDSGLLSQRNIRESTSLGEGGALWTYTSTNLTTDLMVARSLPHSLNRGTVGSNQGELELSGSPFFSSKH